MNHTTLERIVAISLVAAMTTIGLSVLSSAKVMAASDMTTRNARSLDYDNGVYSIHADDSGTTLTGPNGLQAKQPIPQLPDLSSVISGITSGLGQPDQSSSSSP
jgi:hypothetical protein